MFRDEATLLDIWKAAHTIVKYMGELDFDGFIQDGKTQHAILHQFMVLGEAVKRLSMDFRKQHPQIPWRNIAGMRDKLIHFYDGVDYDQVWVSTRKHIPDLILQLEPLVPDVSEE